MELGYLSVPVRQLLTAGGSGARLMPLDFREPATADARKTLAGLDAGKAFPGAASPHGALSGLWLYFNEMDEAHKICQDMSSAEGSFWHGIVHRREPDPSNAAYWFRRAGNHQIFPALLDQAREVSAAHPDAKFSPGNRWDPFLFIDFCEEARTQPGTPDEHLAKEIQLIEWQLLFECCARSSQ